MKAPRLTIGHLLLLVAAIAALFGGGIGIARLAQLRSLYLSRASDHLADMRSGMGRIDFLERLAGSEDRDVQATSSLFASCNRDYIKYHELLYKKYTRASARPWSSLPPDPEAPSPFPVIPPLEGPVPQFILDE